MSSYSSNAEARRGAARSFRVALEARDVDGATALLTDDVVFRSPIVFKPYKGRSAVRQILGAVFQVFDEWRCGREIEAADGRDHAFIFQARIGDRQIEGSDFVHFDHDGLIDEFYVMVRPLSGAIALAEAMRAKLASASDELKRRH